jgi:hypothetical protein
MCFAFSATSTTSTLCTKSCPSPNVRLAKCADWLAPHPHRHQVYMNYGDKNNSQLLLDYGFVETSMTAMQVR